LNQSRSPQEVSHEKWDELRMRTRRKSTTGGERDGGKEGEVRLYDEVRRRSKAAVRLGLSKQITWIETRG
jgi:hypothetical protein